MMMPVAYKFDGHVMIPVNKFHSERAAKQYQPGATYVLIPNEARSPESHRFYFACLHEAWLNLAEEHAERHPTAEHLRAYALVKTGFADKTSIVCSTPEDAIRTAAIASTRDKIRIIEISGKCVSVWIPRSQSMRSMGKAEFERSKQSVLDLVASMARTTRGDLERNADQHA